MSCCIIPEAYYLFHRCYEEAEYEKDLGSTGDASMRRGYPKLFSPLSFCVVRSVTCTLPNDVTTGRMAATLSFVFVDMLEGHIQDGTTSNCSPHLLCMVQVSFWRTRLVVRIGGILIAVCIYAGSLCIMFLIHIKAIRSTGSRLAHCNTVVFRSFLYILSRAGP